MNHPCTREGELFAQALTGPADNAARVLVTGHRPCACGRPGCSQSLRGVGITMDGVSVLAKTPKAVDKIIESLRQAAEFAWWSP